ncbi:hypothetical protein SLS56_010354 [Neofusicoccum ribis]|uniref:Uncharacterized protein n=1 Tax=Neofusicoccum ribis TaxID=45134 RepID=A0ABR3SER6_9PEZI
MIALGDALFSPSKAAQQRAQAHDWQHVEAWLSSLYPNCTLPTFERNDETLKALLALAAANERADEETALVEALEEEVRHEMDETADYVRQTKQLLPKLDEYATRLAALGAADAPAPSSPKHTRTRSAAAASKPPNPLAAPGGGSRALASAAVPASTARLEALAAAEAEVAALRAGVARAEAQVRAFGDLPAGREEAVRVVREREAVLAGLRERRDGGFEALVG